MIGIFRVLEVLLPFALFLTVMAIVLTVQIKAAKRKTKGRSQRPQVQGKPVPPGSSFDLRSNDRPGRLAATHDHIKSTELPHDRKMEQLRTLKEAGLLTQEEYNERYQKILKGRTG